MLKPVNFCFIPGVDKLLSPRGRCLAVEGQPYGAASALTSEGELILHVFGSDWFFGFSCCHLMPWENKAARAELSRI